MIRLQRKHLTAFVFIFLFLGLVLLPSRAKAVITNSDQGFNSTSNNLTPVPDIIQGAQSYFDTKTLNLANMVGVSVANLDTGQKSPNGITGLTVQSFDLMIAGGTNVTTDASGKQVTLYYPGAIGGVMNATSMALGHPPVSSAEYVADLFDNLKHPFVPSAYAQGIGFSSLSPLLELWKLFRDVAYFFFVVVFVVVGFLIMIRAKIGSQAAVTVQQMLPKLVISLILVTFSYAIAGLLLDLMYIIIFLMISIFSGRGLTTIAGTSLTEFAFNRNIVQNMFNLIADGPIKNVANSLSGVILKSLYIPTDQPIGNILQGVAGSLMFLILAVMVLISIIRVFIALLTAYIGIFFSVITAPIQLMFGALPGQNTFGKWIQGLVENMLVFPTIILLFLIAYFFSKEIQGTNTVQGFVPPQLGISQSAADSDAYRGIIVLGVILAMPEVLKVSKGILKGQAGVDLGQLGKNITTGWKGGELVPGLGFTKLPGVGNALPTIDTRLRGSKEERKRQEEIKLLNPLAQTKPLGLMGTYTRAENAARKFQTWREQRLENRRREEQALPRTEETERARGQE